MPISFCRADARTSNRLATLAHAISNTTPTAPSSKYSDALTAGFEHQSRIIRRLQWRYRVARPCLRLARRAVLHDGLLKCDFQRHARLFGSGLQMPTTPMEIESVALLNKVVPNPFTSSMSFAYEVPEGGAGVEIGVYNVAGRLVKALVSGPQSAGRQAITWDGRDGSGVQMARGVYFLKSQVAGNRTTHRVIYMNP